MDSRTAEDIAKGFIAAANKIADAYDRLATAQERIADATEKSVTIAEAIATKQTEILADIQSEI